MSKVKKAGTILINKKENKICLIYREKQKDYSFPKGHLEEKESLIDCAIRETEEETKRKCKILNDNPIYIDEYVTPRGEEVEMYYFLAEDDGISNNDSNDTHEVHWVNFDEVNEKLSYDSLKKVWNSVKEEVKNIRNKRIHI